MRFEPKPFGGFSFYFGADIGAVVTHWDVLFPGNNVSVPFRSVGSDYEFGYQATAGFKYAFARDWEAGICYKFLGTTEHKWDNGSGAIYEADPTFSHSILATLTFKF